MMLPRTLSFSLALLVCTPAVRSADKPPVANAPGSPEKVSYYKQVRPIF